MEDNTEVFGMDAFFGEHTDQSIDKEDSWSDLIKESDETTQSDDSTQKFEDVAASGSDSVK